MFPTRFFNPRYWATRYWPKTGATSTALPRAFSVLASRSTRITVTGQVGTAFGMLASVKTWSVFGQRATAPAAQGQRGSVIVASASE